MAPRTATGVVRLMFVPSPRSPCALLPQQYAAPLGARPQDARRPTLTAVNVSPPLTATGANPQGTVAFRFSGRVQAPLVGAPICPDWLKPQQYALPPVVTPQV